MASGSKKTTSGKSTGKPGRPRKNPAPVQEPEQDSFIRAEVMIIVSFAAAVLLFLSNFHLCGVAGDFLRGVQLGIFGTIGFIVPLLIFIGTSFYMSNRGNPAAIRKLLAAILAVLTLCGFLQLFFGGKAGEAGKVMDYYKISSSTGSGGGLIGGLICGGLSAVLGTIGTFLVLMVCMAVSVVCITEKSIVKAVKKSRDAAYRYAKEDYERRKELHTERQEERRRLREEQHVRGVDLASTDLSLDESLAYEEYEDADDSEDFADRAFADDKKGTAGRKDPAGKAGTEKDGRGAKPAASSNADIFTGKISLPDYGSADEDEAPFAADEVLDPAESAQQLVAQGIADFDQADDIFTGLGPADEKPKAAKDEAVYRRKKPGKAAGADDFRTPADFIDMPEYEDGEPEDDGFDEAERFYPSEVYARETLRQLRPQNSRIPAQTAEPASEPAAEKSAAPEGASADAAAYVNAYAASDETLDENVYYDEADRNTFEDMLDEPPFEADQVKAADGYVKKGVNGGELFIPEETKRVTTAAGKVIETDTEMLKKKLESKKKEQEEQAGEASVQQQIKQKEELPKKKYIYPPLNLLKKGTRLSGSQSDREYRETAIKLQQTLRDFGVGVTVTNISCGPSVTRYELHPEQGVKVSKIVGLADDIKLSLAAADIRIEAPIPGKSAVGIEVPNKENNTVYLRDLLEAESCQKHSSKLAFAVGKDIGGQVVVADIAKMPHLLIAGATGSGKSVCINTLIMSIIYKADPEDVKMIMVDPKVVELSVYNGIPHLLIPVVTDPKKASGALNWAVAEMTDRYKKFAEYNVRDLKGYNAKVEGIQNLEDDKKPKKMPQIVIIVDELADLMMVAPGEVEDAICRLAQLARAAGIHLVIATQRPSVNVITGLIKANVPSRIAFSVSSGVDSRTIIDMNGAEKLLGKGDMLFYPAGYPKPQRVQGAFVSDQEVQKVVDFLTEQGMTSDYSSDVERQMNAAPAAAAGGGKSSRDDYFEQAGKFIIEKEKASIGMLQRVFKIGFNRAARIMDQLAEAGVVGEEEGTKPRKVLMTMEEFEAFMERGE